MNVKKTFRLGNKVLTGQIDLFNALNSNTIWAQNNSVGSSLGVITQTLQGRRPPGGHVEILKRHFVVSVRRIRIAATC